MSLTPFEIRLELLKMAKDMLQYEHDCKRSQIDQEYYVNVDTARAAGERVPAKASYPSFFNEEDVIKKANSLNGFVSQSR